MKPRKISPYGLAFTQARESFSATPYRDTGGVWTIGYGTIYHAGMPNPMTPEQATTYIWPVMHRCEDTVNECVTVDLTQDEFDALCDFAYNEGCHALATSTLVKKINANAGPEAIKAEFLKWDMVHDKHIKGLWNRRMLEDELYVKPDPA